MGTRDSVLSGEMMTELLTVEYFGVKSVIDVCEIFDRNVKTVTLRRSFGRGSVGPTLVSFLVSY